MELLQHHQALQYRRDVDAQEVQGRTMRMVKGTGFVSYKERLRNQNSSAW